MGCKKGNILLKNLNFSYNGEKDILSNINLTIPSKSKIMIIGSSGSGKSTILKLLLKYYQTNKDNIYRFRAAKTNLDSNQIISLIQYLGRDIPNDERKNQEQYDENLMLLCRSCAKGQATRKFFC